MATYTNNSRIQKMYLKPIGRYSSFGLAGVKPKRIRIMSKFHKVDKGKLLSFFLMAKS